MPAVTKFEAGRQRDRCSWATRPHFHRDEFVDTSVAKAAREVAFAEVVEQVTNGLDARGGRRAPGRPCRRRMTPPRESRAGRAGPTSRPLPRKYRGPAPRSGAERGGDQLPRRPGNTRRPRYTS